MTINEQALAAGAKAARFIEPNLYQNPHNPERYYTSVAQEILEAALPHIRKQIAEEIEADLIRKAKAHGWEEGYGDCYDFYMSHGLRGTQTNPYAEES